jgi:hypothetical protein
MKYAEYLQTERWQAVRRAALAGAKHRCERCGWRHQLEVNHITYERLGHELPGDVEVLCSPCHRRYHGITEARRRRVFATDVELVRQILPRVFCDIKYAYERRYEIETRLEALV